MTESELINFGVLNGWLKSIARVNDKTNNGHEFVIIKHPKSMSLNEFCDSIFSTTAEEIKINQIKKLRSLLIEKFSFWFYQFQPNNALKESFLEDKTQDFSLSDEEWKIEWVQEFVDLLITTLKPTEGYYVDLKRTKKYYCNMSDDIILVGENQYFRIHCCLTD